MSPIEDTILAAILDPREILVWRARAPLIEGRAQVSIPRCAPLDLDPSRVNASH
jgi:hypothetical protein